MNDAFTDEEKWKYEIETIEEIKDQMKKSIELQCRRNNAETLERREAEKRKRSQRVDRLVGIIEK